MADVDSQLRQWSATASSNKPTGATSIGSNLDDNLRAIQATVRQYLASPGSTIASAATVDLSTADGRSIPISGTSTVTGLGTEVSGIEYLLTTTAAVPLIHSSALTLPGAANITTAAGDYFLALSKGAGNWVVPWFTKASGLGVSSAPFIDSTPLIRGSADATKLVALEVDGLTTATTRTLTIQDKSGTVTMVADISKNIQGMTYANAAGDVTNDIDIAAGICTDATGLSIISLAAITKQLDVNWVVGTNQGGLDTGVIGNSDYYIWAIKRSDTGVTDALYSLSSTAPTMPASYDFKRLIGWFKRVGATIVLFNTYEIQGGGLELLWSSPTLDINLANTLTTSRRTDAVKVPLNFSVIAHLNVLINDAVRSVIWVYCPDQADQAPSLTVTPLSSLSVQVGTAAIASQMKIRTSAAGLIAARSDQATTDLYAVVTLGFTWARRN